MTARRPRLLVPFLVASAVLQGILFSLLAPLLPSFEAKLGLSEAGIGVLSGSFAMGEGLVAIPIALLAAHVGARRLALTGLALLSVASVGLGVAGSFEAVTAARFAQGVSAGLCFAAGFAWVVDAVPRAQRARFVGVVSAGGSAGHMLGPLVGAAGVRIGRLPVSLAVASAGVALIGLALSLPEASGGSRQSPSLVLAAHREPGVLAGLWLIALPGMLTGAIFTLAPLELGGASVSPAGIGGIFLVSAGIGVIARPLVGAWADSNGILHACRRLLLVSVPLTATIPWIHAVPVLAFLIICAVASYGVVFGPAMTFTANAYERQGVTQVVGFSLVAAVVGCSLFAGAALGGLLATALSDAAVFSLLALLTAGTAVAAASRPSRRNQNAAAPNVPG